MSQATQDVSLQTERRGELPLPSEPRGVPNTAEVKRIHVNIVGIDPGKTGGLAVIRGNGNATAYRMPDTSRGVVRLLEELRESGVTTAFMELVGGYIGRAQPASSAFVFGYGTGIISGALAAYGFETHRIRPQTWLKSYGLKTRDGESKTSWKNRLKAQAEDLFPNIPGITLSTSDALLIAEFGRRWMNGNIVINLTEDES